MRKPGQHAQLRSLIWSASTRPLTYVWIIADSMNELQKPKQGYAVVQTELGERTTMSH